MKNRAFMRWIGVAAALAFFSPPAMAIVTGAFWTTSELGEVDKNIYLNKCDLYLSGGPKGQTNNNLIDGDYYYQITDPNGDLLSTSPAANRIINVSDGFFTGLAVKDDAELSANDCGYSNATNGEYKAWLIRVHEPDCHVQIAGDGVTLLVTGENGKDSMNACSKSDNFRIETDDGGTCTEGDCPCPCGYERNGAGNCVFIKACVTPTEPKFSISKDADGLYDVPWSWTIAKSGCAAGTGGPEQPPCLTTVKQQGGSVLFNYLLTLAPTAGTPQNYEVVGSITITGQDGNDSNGDPVYASGFSLFDQIAYGLELTNDPNATCALDDPGALVGLAVQQGSPAVLGYHCSYTPDLPADTAGETNQVFVASENSKTVDDPTTNIDEAIAAFEFGKDEDIDECVNVSDAYMTVSPVKVCNTDESRTISYSKSFTVTNTCVDYTNTATFATLDNSVGPVEPASVTVRVCGALKTGALTMGFWQNKNGQDIIKQYCGGTSGTSLNAFLTGYNPFKDLTTSVCSASGSNPSIQKYVLDIIKSASASGASMNAMLKAQMLATALDVYFSDPALGGNRIGAGTPLGGQSIDLTQVCKNIATCSIYEDTTSAFGGTSPQTVSQLLTNAGNQCTSPTTGCKTTSWYVVGSAQSKSLQELAKDTFDAINNQKAFGP